MFAPNFYFKALFPVEIQRNWPYREDADLPRQSSLVTCLENRSSSMKLNISESIVVSNQYVGESMDSITALYFR